ncbi:MAG: CDP-alcohol phosphatidyltransferase family protein [Prevotella sp.]|nr:CDP-alcohol phosphatidyltransferase family protein [Candidatus Prevotella equi]
MTLLEKAKATLKSSETDDWLDIKVVRPLAYLCAVAFNVFGTHPNTVTIISMIIGAGSCVLFAHGSSYYEGSTGLMLNIIAVLLLIVADILDCTDGQLARMTGKTSRIGRILDGAAGFVWFVPIYLALVYRFYYYHELEFSFLGIADTETNVLIATAIVFILGNISGFNGIGRQQRLADYYIQCHLFFLKGEKGSELDNSRKQQEILDAMPKDEKKIYKMFQKSYVDYTLKQEQSTPQFQKMMAKLREKYGSYDNIPAEFREKFHALSLPLIKINGLLTFNFRTAWFILFVLIDLPVEYFLFEVICMESLYQYIRYRHESFCKKLTAEL